MKETPESRIVVVSSRAHTRGKIEFDNLNCEKSHPGTMQLYSNAKLANVLFSNELARRLSGTGFIFFVTQQKLRRSCNFQASFVTASTQESSRRKSAETFLKFLIILLEH